MDIVMPPGLTLDGQIHPTQDAVYLTSYPRCGSTWLRYCFEFITKTASNPELDPTWETGASLPQFLYSSHKFADSPYRLDFPTTLEPLQHIWLRRNPMEAIWSQAVNVLKQGMRTHGDNMKMVQLFPAFAKLQKEMNICSSSSTTEILHFYETVCLKSEDVAMGPLLSDIGTYYNKLVGHAFVGQEQFGLALRYEDLVEKPDKTLLQLIDYLVRNNPDRLERNTLLQNLEELLENYAFHQEAAMNTYRGAQQTNIAASTKKGISDLYYYTDLVSPEFIKLFENLTQLAWKIILENQPRVGDRQMLKQAYYKYMNCYDRRWRQ